jgi:hypothetical protein
MGNVKHEGHYQCPRCSGRDYYFSEETAGAYAMTLNAPGPVDPTIVNTIKKNVARCNQCQSEMKWIPSSAALKARETGDQKYYAFTGLFLGILVPIVLVGGFAYVHFVEGPTFSALLLGSVELRIIAGFLILLSVLLIRSGLKNRKRLREDSQKYPI